MIKLLVIFAALLSSFSFAENVNIEELRAKVEKLEKGQRMSMLTVTWARFEERLEENGLQYKYAQTGDGSEKFSPAQVISNDETGYRRAMVWGKPNKVLSTIGLLQREIPLSIDQFKFKKGEFESEIFMFVKVRGSVK